MGKPPAQPGMKSGWYPDPSDPTKQWFWDGSAWTREERRAAPPPVPRSTLPRARPRSTPTPPASPPAPLAAAPATPPAKSRKPIYWSRLTGGLILRALIVAAIAGAAVPAVVAGGFESPPPQAVLSVVGVVLAGLFFVGIVAVELRTSPDEIKCAKCGTRFKSGYTTCRKCGHTIS